MSAKQLKFRIVSLAPRRSVQVFSNVGYYLQTIHSRFSNATTRIYTCRKWAPDNDEIEPFELRWNDDQVPDEQPLGSFSKAVDEPLIRRVEYTLKGDRAVWLFIYNSDAELCFQEMLTPNVSVSKKRALSPQELEEQRLIEHIRDARYSEEAILVYGDFLSAHDDPRGPLIAMEAAGRLSETDPLLTQVQGSLPVLVQREARLIWRHGHVVEAKVTRPKVLRLLLGCPAARLLQRLEIAQSISRKETIPQYVQLLEGSGLLDLDMSSCRIGPEESSALFDSPALMHLESLNLKLNHLGREGVEALVKSPHLGRLKRLNLAYNRLGDRGVLPLVDAKHLRLSELNLQNNNVSRATMRALREAEHFAKTELDLG